jgi:hypothetical protein
MKEEIRPPDVIINADNEHDFLHNRSCNFCFFCQNTWPANETVVSQYNICTKCSFGVHAGCVSVTKQCCPCGISPRKMNSRELHKVNCNGMTINILFIMDSTKDSFGFQGVLHIKLKHAYDMQVSVGTTIVSSNVG